MRATLPHQNLHDFPMTPAREGKWTVVGRFFSARPGRCDPWVVGREYLGFYERGVLSLDCERGSVDLVGTRVGGERFEGRADEARVGARGASGWRAAVAISNSNTTLYVSLSLSLHAF